MNGALFRASQRYARCYMWLSSIVLRKELDSRIYHTGTMCINNKSLLVPAPFIARPHRVGSGLALGVQEDFLPGPASPQDLEYGDIVAANGRLYDARGTNQPTLQYCVTKCEIEYNSRAHRSSSEQTCRFVTERNSHFRMEAVGISCLFFCIGIPPTMKCFAAG